MKCAPVSGSNATAGLLEFSTYSRARNLIAIAAAFSASNGKESILQPRTEMAFNLSLKHSCGKLLIKDDAVLMRLTVKTEREPTQAFKTDIQRLYLGYFITWELLCMSRHGCDCHMLPPRGWHSATCCPDCGPSLVSNVEG